MGISISDSRLVVHCIGLASTESITITYHLFFYVQHAFPEGRDITGELLYGAVIPLSFFFPCNIDDIGLKVHIH